LEGLLPGVDSDGFHRMGTPFGEGVANMLPRWKG
jgi:hypothetical protein